jgi:hypothetical protein
MAIVSIQYDLNKQDEAAEYDIARNAMKYRRFISKLIDRDMSGAPLLEVIADTAREVGLPEVSARADARKTLS